MPARRRRCRLLLLRLLLRRRLLPLPPKLCFPLPLLLGAWAEAVLRPLLLHPGRQLAGSAPSLSWWTRSPRAGAHAGRCARCPLPPPLPPPLLLLLLLVSLLRKLLGAAPPPPPTQR